MSYLLKEKKYKSGIVLGVVILGLGIVLPFEKSKDVGTVGIIETDVSTTTVTCVEEDYIDVNAELNNISDRRNPNETSVISDATIREIPKVTIEAIQETVERIVVETIETEPEITDFVDTFGDGTGNAGFNSYDEPMQQNTVEYVLNTNTMKFHIPSCSSVKRIKPENFATIDSRDNAINSGYVSCGRCHP